MTIHGAKGLEFHYVFIAGLGKLILEYYICSRLSFNLDHKYNRNNYS